MTGRWHQFEFGISLAVVVAALAVGGLHAQTRYTYSSGQPLNPSYEGWWPNDDGSYELFFGYMNTNWLQEFDIPIGADNNIQSAKSATGEASRTMPDGGQPTHFYPRRNPFLFTIRVPKDFGNNELIWTLTANGTTEHAYATLKPDYQIDKQVISTEVGGDNGSLSDALRTNIPPELKVDGEKTRTVKVGEPLALSVFARDPDNIPARRGGARGAAPPAAAAAAAPEGRGTPPMPAAPARAAQPPAPARGVQPPPAPRPPIAVTASSGPGLRFSWMVYRGKADAVTFDPVQMKTWEDTRAYANSPWSPPYLIPEVPPDNKWLARATFKEPGRYVLRGVASDGSLFTYENITVNVTK